MKNCSTRILSVSLSLLFFLSACQIIQNTDEIVTPDWSPEIAIPIVDSDISLQLLIEEAIPNDLISSGPEEVITLVYQTELLTVSASDIFGIPDIPIPMFNNEVSIPFPIGTLNQIHLKEGKLHYQFSLPDSRSVQIDLNIPDAYLFGIPFERSIFVQGEGMHADSVDLAEYQLDLSDGTLTFIYQARYTDDQNELSLSDFQYRMTDLTHSYVDGYFGTASLSLGDDSTGLSVAGELIESGFRLEDPRLGLIFYNSIGIPMEIKASELEVITNEHGALSLLTDSLRNGFPVAHPSMTELGVTKSSGAFFTKDNSQIVEALAGKPQAFDWDIALTTHPSRDSTETGFLTDSSTFRIDLWAEVPLHGSLQTYEFDKVVEVDMKELEQLSSAALLLITENGIPLEMNLQAYFEDENGTSLDSLFDAPQPILGGPSLLPDGAVDTPAKEEIEISLSDSQLSSLLPATHIRLHIQLGTSGGGQVPVKLFPENSLGIKLGIKGELGL